MSMEDDNIVMPDFASSEEDARESAALPVEEVSLDPEALVAPVFVPTTYNWDEPTTHEGSSTPVEIPESREAEGPPKRRRGRPPGSKNRPKGAGSEVQLDNPNVPLTSALRRKTDQELSRRAQGILIGATKIPSVINPHIEMREDEAQAIADPLVSYAKSHMDSERIEQFVEQWDLIAVGIASAAYGMRVVKETRDDPNIGRGRASHRVSESPRPRVVQALPNNPEPERNFQTEQQGPSYQQFSEDANFTLPPSEPVIGEL